MDINKIFWNKSKQRDISSDQKRAEVKKSLINIMALASKIDAHLIIYSSEGALWVAGAGLEDDFEGLAFLRRAEYLINREGIPIP